MDNIILPAIIADTQEQLTQIIKKIEDITRTIHLDFMDGQFVPNPSLDFDFEIPETDIEFEAHLMVSDPEAWIDSHGTKVDTILVHIETTKDPENVISMVKSKNKRIGFVLNPETPLKTIEPYLDKIDQVLIMTVNPGYYGSPFLPEMLEKIKTLRSLSPKIDIEADGSINDKTITSLKEAGVNIFCSGSYIIKSKNPEESIKLLHKKLKN